MSEPCISVVIPCFNHGEFLAEAVASVTNIKRDDIELIVVDDGSTDDRTCEEMDSLRARGIKVVWQENKGLAAARNAGIRASQGDYILPLDADNRIRTSYLKHSIRILDSNPQIGVVYGDAEFFGTRTGRWTVGRFQKERLLTWNYIDACAVLRRCVWEENEGYDCTMPIQGLEDWDFWLGALEHGWEFAYVPEILFDYRVVKESMITRTFGFEAQVEEFIAAKHWPLYRPVWIKQMNDYRVLVKEHNSLKATFRNLTRLLKSRLLAKFQNELTCPLD